VIFGHALWEMLMQPFIGLTAKVLVLNVNSNEKLRKLWCEQDMQFAYSNVPSEPSAIIDECLADAIRTKFAGILKQESQEAPQRHFQAQRSKFWLPMPLLGIPQWSHVEQDDRFYQDQTYFMPKAQSRPKPI
jgi:hypothetical protein